MALLIKQLVIFAISVFSLLLCQTGHGKILPLFTYQAQPPQIENRLESFKLEALVETKAPLDCTAQEDLRPLLGKNGYINPRYRWTNFSVYIDPAYNQNERTLINNGISRLDQALPCVNFLIYPPGAAPYGDYVHVKKLGGCWSYVGRIGGSQDLSLQSPGCMSIGTIMHEMIHALGFWHEQSRPDRDDYVTIQWQNIQHGTEHNFNKYSPQLVTSFGIPYNQRSIMHYGARAFSSNGNPTIVAKDGSPIGSTGDLQQTDIDKLRKMYNC